jgi:hypothetical protein
MTRNARGCNRRCLLHQISNDPRPSRPSRSLATEAAAGGGGPAGAGRPRRFAVRWSALAWGGALLLIGIGLFILYLRQSRLAPFNADGASNELQAWAMLHGNPLLKGWWTTDVSWYTTELPEYMVLELFRGLRPDVVHVGGALTFTLVVLLGALLARGQARGAAGVFRAVLAGGIIFAPTIAGGTAVFLQEPDHTGTVVPILVLLLIMDRAAERWWVPAVACVLLAWTQVGDQLTLVAATLPVGAVAVARMIRLAMRHRPRAEFRFDALLLGAAAASAGLAEAAHAAIRALGGFALQPLPPLFAPLSQVPANVRTLGQALLLLFGANFPGKGRGGLDFVAHLHLIGLALAVAGLAVGIATFFFSRTDRVSQIVVAATLAMVAAAVFTTELPALHHAHEFAALLPFGAVLAGRMLPPLVPARWRAGWAVTPLLAAYLAAGLAALCYMASWLPMRPPYQTLADWLVSHHYTEGLAEYWQANSTTVSSGGKVIVAPISPQATAARHWDSWIGWYDASRRTANFVVAVTDPGSGAGGLSTTVVRDHFGPPAHEYSVAPDLVVMVYDYNLLTKLTGREFPGTGQ